MKYLLIAGEASGDLHASKLMAALKQYDNQAQFHFFGGDHMAQQGGKLIQHYKDTAFMGAFDVIKNYHKIKLKFKLVQQQLSQFKPNAVILIDYPGFNLRVAQMAKQYGIKVIYYISPKVWAWNKKRVYKIKQFVDRMYVIFPFEVEFYKQYDYEVFYFGNPTVDEVYEHMEIPFDVRGFYLYNGLNPEKLVIALLPGSRHHEISLILPEMDKVARRFSDYQFVVAGLSQFDLAFYRRYTDLPVIFDQTYDLLRVSYAALVASGTATLETALFGVPQVVVYKAPWLQFYIGRMIVKVKYFSLVNILLQREAVKELLQFKLAERMSEELYKILENRDYRNQISNAYAELKRILGEPGSSLRIAKDIVNFLSS